MRIAIVHNKVGEESRIDEKDVLIQSEAVSRALQELNHETITLGCSLDLDEMERQLSSIGPDMVFNLVESLAGEGRFIHFFPGLLDAMGIPYTGSPTEVLCVTSHKVLAKERMTHYGLATPAWRGPYPADIPCLQEDPPQADKKTWLIKSLWEHGSLGLDDSGPISGVGFEKLDKLLVERAPMLGRACFAEVFIPGREFNLSLLMDSEGPRVLPPAEICFENYDDKRLRIVGYRAKWESESFEFHHTPRRFDFPPGDTSLLETLTSMAVRCWQCFGMRGYCRVDFRVDPDGRPWILEINSNPCLSPDAGFAAAVSRAGMTYKDAVAKIIADTVQSKEVQ